MDNEVEVLKSGSSLFNVNFENNLWKVQSPPANVTSTQIINNQSPLFDSINTNNNFYNFRLKAGSPAIDKGVNTATSIDLDGKPRSVGLPDLGCFERQ
ncbi:MAG: choice-of-anchor Q domain-containing protein [Chitinophagaceae bacterium]